MITNPSTTLYTLGRGILSIAEWGISAPGAYRDVGNCSKFECNVTESELEHYSYRTGLKNKDKVVTLETGYDLAFTLDEFSVQNLAMFLKGTLVGQSVVRANTAMDREYAIKFVSDNPVGPNEVWEFWKCKLAPGGALSLIEDKWLEMSFKATGLSDAALHSTSPFFTVTFETTTTTNSTTTS